MSVHSSRRQWLTQTAASAAGVAAVATAASAASAETPKPQVRYCLNTSTIRGQKLPITQVVDLAAKAGYQAIEPWMNELQQYQSQGGSLSDLKKRIADAGLTVESAIGFAEWIVDDDARRAKGLEQARRDMDLVKQIGGVRIAAPPAGATKEPRIDLFKAAERYRALLEVGREIGVVPQVEVWGFSANLSRLGETTLVAIEAQHPDACILPDVYHLYKGGSEFAGLKLLAGTGVQVFHMNDYPAEPPRATINDAARVFCGDGVAPLTQILQTMFAAGFRGVLSLELFNPEYYKQDPLQVVKTGLEKMQAAVAKATAAQG
jgi:sugar phosphate isomerase/epimerase